MAESWTNLAEIWGNSEKILYVISNAKGEIPRKDILSYAKPTSSKLEELLNSKSVELNDEKDIKEILEDTQENDKYCGINFQNLGEYKNTIEIRLANGTLDADTWIENINLFGGLVRASQELAIIQTTEKNRSQILNK